MNHCAVKTVDFGRWRVDLELTEELAGREARLAFLEASNDLPSLETCLAIEIARLNIADALRVR